MSKRLISILLALVLVCVGAVGLAEVTVTYKASDAANAKTYTDTNAVSGMYAFLSPGDCGFTAPEGQAFDCWLWYMQQGSDKVLMDLLAAGDEIHLSSESTNEIVANWYTPGETYTVSFDMNGGKVDMMDEGIQDTMDPGEVEAGRYAMLPPAHQPIPPTEDLAFSHWEIDGQAYAGRAFFKPTGDVVAKAIWADPSTLADCDVVFVPNNGTQREIVKTTKPCLYTLPTPEAVGVETPEGKRFKAWRWNGSEYAVGGKIRVVQSARVSAVWVNTYDVTFEAGSGTGSMDSVTLDEGEVYVLPECGFTAPQYQEFKAWLVNGTELGPGGKIEVTAPTSVIAVWDYKEIAITYDPNGSVDSWEGETFNCGEEYSLRECNWEPPVGHEFDCWLLDGVRYEEGYTFVPTESMRFVAQWKKLSYPVRFDANGGSGEGPAAGLSVEYNDSYELPACTFTAPQGKEFKAWSVDGKEYAAGQSITVTQETTVKAVWKNQIFTVTYDLNGMTGSYPPVEVEYGETHSLRDPSGIDYPESMQFDGWQIGDEKHGPGYSLMVTGDITVVAQWKERLVSLTYLDDDGNVVKALENLKYGVEHTELAPQELGLTAPQGYEFNCWMMLNTRGGVIGEAYVGDEEPLRVFSNWSLKPNWVKKTKTYTLTLDMNGGNPVDGIEVYEGAYFEMPPAHLLIHPAGLEFDYFDIGDGNKYYPSDLFPATGDTVAVAHWIGEADAVKYTVTFDAGEGTGSMDAMTVFEGATITLPECRFTAPTGHSFMSWIVGSTNAAPGANITVTGDMTVTAQWQANLYEVELNPGEGSGQTMTETMPYGHAFKLPGAGVLGYTGPEGKSFKCWSMGGKEYAAGDTITITGETKLTALWTSNTYAVLFDANGGTGTMKGAQVEYGTQYKVPGCLFAAPKGYGFKGWSVNGTQLDADAVITVTQSVTLKAVWQKDIYTVTTVDSNDTGTVKTETVEYGASYTLPACPYTAQQYYTFSYWKVETAAGTVELKPGAVITIDSSAKITAMWDFDNSVQTRIDQVEDISSLPPAQKAEMEQQLFAEMPKKLQTVDAVVAELTEQVTDNTGFEAENVEVHDVKLMFKPANSETWIEADKENFPTAGIEVRMPIPEGANATDYDFMIIHMFTVDSERLGIKAGDTETVIPQIVGNELVFTLNGLSPVSIAYKVKELPVESLPETGDPSSLLSWMTLLGASGAGLRAMKRRKK